MRWVCLQICHLITPASNLGYLAPPCTVFHGYLIVNWDSLNAKQSCSQKKFGMGCVKYMVSMATHGGFENEGTPTK